VLIDSWNADVNEAWLVDGLAQASFAPIRMVTNSALSDTASFASLFKLATLAPLTARFVAVALELCSLIRKNTLLTVLLVPVAQEFCGQSVNGKKQV
jgi:hypothetical protein